MQFRWRIASWRQSGIRGSGWGRTSRTSFFQSAPAISWTARVVTLLLDANRAGARVAASARAEPTARLPPRREQETRFGAQSERVVAIVRPCVSRHRRG